MRTTEGLMPLTPDAQIADTTTFCTTFPEKLDDEVLREHILHTIDQLLVTDMQIVVVWGREGIGKTTLLAQFARSRAQYAASIFVRSNTRFGYEPEHILLDLTMQMALLAGKPQEQLDTFHEAQLSKQIYDLQRKANKTNRKYIVVIDGIEDIPKEDETARDAILSRLPLGYPQFRFIFSGHKGHITDPRFAQLRQSPVPLMPFSEHEARHFMGSQLSNDLFTQFYSVTKGIPGDLASYKRMLLAGIPEQELIADLPRTLTEKYDVEWKSVDGSNRLQLNVLAIVALDRTAHTLLDLEFFLKRSPHDIRSSIAGLNFLEIGTSPTSEIRYTSEAFRKFAACKLDDWKVIVSEMLINALLGDPNSIRSMYQLPGYLLNAQQPERLLVYLSPDHFANMLAQSQSVHPLRQQVELGLETALRLKKDGDLLRFAVQEASILDLDVFGVSRDEIDARVAIGDDDQAVALATSAVLKQDRLRLLARLCRAQTQNGRSVGEELLDQIRTLLNEVDIRDLGERAMDLAADLMRFLPDKAINVVERMAKSPGGKSLDIALAQLSLLGITARQQQQSELKKTCDDVRIRITDPNLRVFSLALSGALRQYSGEEILAETHKLSNHKDQLFLLRQWATLSTKYSSSVLAVKYALTLAIETTEYTPDATHFRELATPLPHVSNKADIAELIAMIDTQKANTEHLGPTEEYVWLQLTLAEAEHKLSYPRMAERVEDVYLYVSDISDLTVKTACLARLLSILDSVDPEQTLETKDRVHSSVRLDFDTSMARLLSETADHFRVVRGALTALSSCRPEHALAVAEGLNTETRRDDAYAAIVEAQLALPVSAINFAVIEKALARIVDTEQREEGLADVISRLSVADAIVDNGQRFKDMLPLLHQITKITDTAVSIRTLGHAVSLTRRLSDINYPSVAEHFHRVLSASWQKIDSDWLKADLGFKLGSILADSDRAFAVQCIAEANACRKKLTVIEGSTTFTFCVRLLIRAFAGLLENKINTPEDLFRLEQLVARIPSDRMRAHLWGELALRCFGSKDDALGRRIVNDTLRPLVARLKEDNLATWSRTICILAPAFYFSHHTSGLELIAQLPQDWIDFAYDEVISFILRKTPGNDAFDPTNERYRVDFHELIDVCSILKLIETDWIIYRYIEIIVNCLLWKENRVTISTQQKADIEGRLNTIVDGKFTNIRFIQHDGYKIIARAQIYRLKRRADMRDDLVSAARAIPNVADRAMVLGILVTCLTHLDTTTRTALFHETKKLNDQIPFLLDRIAGLRALADAYKDGDQTFSRQCLKEAFGLLKLEGDSEAPWLCRGIIDAAHSLSPE